MIYTSEEHNLTFNGSASTLFQSTTGKVLVFCLLIPIPILAIVGNLFIVAVVARFPSLRTTTNAFVVSLAVADFLVAVLVMPFSLARSVDSSWHFGHCFCTAHFLLDVYFCTSSIFHLSCVALDRYVAVCDPLHYPARMSPKRVAILLLMLCWILPLVLSSLCVFLGMYTQAEVGTGSTQLHTQTCLATFHVPYAFATSAISFFVPMGFMLFAYGRIFKAARRQAKWIHANDQHTEQLGLDHSTVRTISNRRVQACLERYSLKKHRKAVKTLGLIMGVFVFCWLPFFCMNVVNPMEGYSISPFLLEASAWLGYANSSLNPFLYAFFNKNYCHVFAAMFDCRQLRAGLDCSLFRRGAQNGVTLETISR